jgi:protein-ribulosamine 3-kinase
MSQQSQEQYQFIAEILSKHTGESANIDDFQFFYGGNFNLAVRLRVKNKEFFIKWTQGEHKGLFDAEAKNLQTIQATGAIPVPSVLGVGTLDEKEYLMMECIESTDKQANYWQDFGEKLAHLHHHSNPLGHGLAYSNFIGAAKQENDWMANGIQFFIINRLKKQVDLALYDRKITPEMGDDFQKLYERLPDLLPNETPALIHGDLWAGNAMVNEQGLVTLVDPCCYYGLREAELAFTTMFGGFDTAFYEAYNATFAIEKGFHARIPLYNLYPLLVHVNLFGEGYLPAVNKILATY